MTGMLNIEEPSNFYEANNSSEWKEAMKEEYESIIKNNTWDLVKRLNDKQPIGCRWLFKLKFKADGSINKHKARLVAKGYSQKEGIDFEEKISPVAKLSTIRLIIALATKHHWKIHLLDVKSSFLNGDLKEEVYLVQPEGFIKKGEEHLVCRLKKDLYGLKWAPRSWYEKIHSFFCLKWDPRSWYEKIDSFFLMYGYKQSKNDPNLYTVFSDEGHIVLISLYVDNLIMTGSADNLIEEIKQWLSQKFEMKDLGEMYYCLGLEVWRDSNKTFLSQGKYVKSLLTKFKMDECKAAFVPLQQNRKFQVDGGLKYADATLYIQLVGSLIYLTTTRPDLAYAMSVLSYFMTRPHENHWIAVKGVLRYLQGTSNFGIFLF